MKLICFSNCILAVLLTVGLGGPAMATNETAASTASATLTETQKARSVRINKAFNEFNITQMSLLDGFYDVDIEFIDPVHKLNGMESLKKYYADMYKNVQSIRFDFTSETVQGDTHVMTWVMHLSASGLNGGKPVAVDGTSILKFNPATDKVIYHRDYLDMGQFIYEHIPVLGSVIRYIKGKMAGH